MSDARDTREGTALERRQWVRLTRVCNNRCLFCLDSDAQDGTMVPADQVRREILQGVEEGAARLVLSGGEPTLHPDFLAFVSEGRRAGYRWVQTITNGRMFSYRAFAAKALTAGLDEATFSLHGHTAELHDGLTGVPGAFDQALRGLGNLVGRCVVNVDVVLNRRNVPHLREILEFFMARGITEFDLLHTVPFGLAWRENREELFYDPVELAPHLERAFALRHRAGIHLWTNRLPARFLEGAEDLIQDPRKTHDEVRGRRDPFERWVDTGEPLPCRDDRCPLCALQGFCDRLEGVLRTLKEGPAGHVVRVRADAARRFGDAAWPPVLPRPPEVHLELLTASPADALRWLADTGIAPASLCLVVNPWDGGPAGWKDLLARADAVRLGPPVPATGGGEALAAWRAAPRRGRLEIPVVPALCGMDAPPGRGPGTDLPREGGEAFYLPVHGGEGLDLAALRTLHEATGRPVLDLPPCLGTGAPPRAELPELDLSLLDATGRLDLDRFTDDFVASRALVKSRRCTSCRLDRSCPGIPVSFARRFGLRSLQPLGD